MRQFLLAVLSVFCLSVAATAQTTAPAGTTNIKGSVIDSATNKPLGYVTVSVLDAKTNQPVKGSLSKDDGSFELAKLQPKAYKLVLAFVGYQNKSVNVTTKEGTTAVGKILMSASSKQLGEVSITAVKPIIKQEVDRISYDIQADPENKVLNVLDMLRKVPMISLDADDNIKLKGSGSYKILINGKPSSLVARSPKDVFRAMPASSIEKIEVITNPPAKYDSEGLEGLINIITKKKLDNGYNGSVNLNYRTPTGGPGAGGSLTVKQGKFGLSTYFGTNRFKQPTTGSSSTRRTFSGSMANNDTSSTRLVQDGNQTYKSNYSYLGAELSYEIDTLNLLTAELNFNGGKSNNNSFQASVLTNTIADTILQRYNNNNFGRSNYNGIDAALNYQLGFKRNKEQLLTLSYKYSVWNDDSFNNLNIDNRLYYNIPNYQQLNNSQSKEQTIQVDYVHPLKKLTIEAGIKGILRDNNSDFGYDQAADATGLTYNRVDSLSNRYQNYQYVIGAYNSYTYNYKGIAFKGGLRLEETIIDADFISNGTNLNRHFLNLIPSISINKRFKDNSSVNFGFTQRIQRPEIYNLNPFIDRSNPNFQSTGNPNLVPVVSNNLQIGYSKFKKGSINIGLNYRFSNNSIQQVDTYNPATKVTLTTYENIGHNKALGSNFNINYPITKAWNVSLNGNLNYMWIDGIVNGVRTENEGLQGYFFASTGYKFNKGWRVNANYSYNSPYITLQGQSNAYNYSSFSLNKEIIKDKLTFSGSVANPFSKFRDYVRTTSGPNFEQNTFSQSYYRSFSFSLNYRFGKLKADIKKNQRSINNDDKGGGKSAN
ncbi:outer membrane beta-barrel family protein [Mucilaginibacter koreensis]